MAATPGGKDKHAGTHTKYGAPSSGCLAVRLPGSSLPCRPAGEQLEQAHDAAADLHQEDVADVDDEQDGHLVPLQLAVPREPDEEDNGGPVHKRIPAQWPPVQVEGL